MSYAVAKQFRPSSGIDHCIAARFLHEDEVNLVVCKTNFLQVFRVREENVQTPVDKQSKPTQILELAFEQKLFGNVESVNVVRLPGRRRDALLFSFFDAKVCCFYAPCFLPPSLPLFLSSTLLLL